VEFETNPRIKRIWERFLDYELGQLRFVADLFQEQEGRDAAEILPASLPEPIRYESHREFVRDVLRAEVTLSAVGSDYADQSEETTETRAYRDQLNSDGSPSDTVAAGYIWMPGTELVTKTDNGHPAGSRAGQKGPNDAR
jgi:hypothetical protein